MYTPLRAWMASLSEIIIIVEICHSDAISVLSAKVRLV